MCRRYNLPCRIAVASMLALAALDASAASGGADPRLVPRHASAITINGVLDDPAWVGALTIELAFEVRPGENIPAPVRTEVLITHDGDAVYFAFRAHDPDPSEIRAHLRDRDSTNGDDWVAVILDTFNDERRSFDLVVNPLGVQADFIETSTGGDEWDAIWESSARITEWGYAVEMRVPFSSLRFQRTDGPQVWGFDAVRSYPRSVRHRIATFPRERGNTDSAAGTDGYGLTREGRSLFAKVGYAWLP